ncbi:ROK family transcriptional regulator [Pseudogracilibacillus sp. SE30717A]|uniref:ROK family transcriptional regulator n=1 Tax=Pseudogracilibacillus sp. SE30717A TaxID=3098293 RepID=UPI00300E177F
MVVTSQLKYDQKNVRKYHYFLLLSLIQKHKKISRSQLAELTRMSNTTVGKIVKELIQDELVIESGQEKGEVGRKAIFLEINPHGAYIIGIEIDVVSVQIALVSLNGTVLTKRQFKSEEKGKPEVVLDKVASEISLLLEETDPKYDEKIIAIGLTMAGLVTWPEGKALMVPQFQWNEVEIKEYLQSRLMYDVYVDNHVRSILLAESLFGTIKNYKDAVCIHVGSGVGGAVMINGEISRGTCNTLGEIGHITMEPNGQLCDCGRLGCLQTFICSSELEKYAQVPIEEIFIAYDKEEEWSKNLIDRAKKYLGITIANVICMYNPEVVLLAGPMIEDYPILLEDIEQITDEHMWKPLKRTFKLAHSTIGKDSGVIGASALVLNEFLRQSRIE